MGAKTVQRLIEISELSISRLTTFLCICDSCPQGNRRSLSVSAGVVLLYSDHTGAYPPSERISHQGLVDHASLYINCLWRHSPCMVSLKRLLLLLRKIWFKKWYKMPQKLFCLSMNEILILLSQIYSYNFCR